MIFKYVLISVLLLLLGLTGVCLTNSRSKLSTTHKDVVYIYFGKTIQNKLTIEPQPVKREIWSNKSIIFAVIEELLKGPRSKEKEENFFTEIPSSTRLIEVRESPENIIINLSKEFETGGGSETMIYRLKQVAYTILEIENEKPVFLELDGEKIKYISGEGVEVPQPLEKDYFNQKGL